MPRIPEVERRFLPSARDAVVPAASHLALVVADQVDRAAEMEYRLKATAEQTEIDNTLLKLKTDIAVSEEKYANERNPDRLRNDLGYDLDQLSTSVLDTASSDRVRSLMSPQVAANIELAQVRVNSKVRMLTIDNAKASVDESMQQLAREAALARDPMERQLAIDQFTNQVNAHEMNGVLKATEATNYRQAFGGTIDQYDFQKQLADDPYQAREMLDDPNVWTNMPDPVRRAAGRAADARIDQIERRAIAAQTHADAVSAKQLKRDQDDEATEGLKQIQQGVPLPDGGTRPMTQNDIMENSIHYGFENTKSLLATLRLPEAIQPNPAVAKEVNDRWDQGLDASDVITRALEDHAIDAPTHDRYRAANRQAQGGVRNWAIKAEGDIAAALKTNKDYDVGTNAQLAKIRRDSVHSLQAFVADGEAAGKPKTKAEIDDFTAQLIDRAVEEGAGQRPIRIPIGVASDPALMDSNDPAENLTGLKLAADELAKLRAAGLIGDQQYRLEIKLLDEWDRYIKQAETMPKRKTQ